MAILHRLLIAGCISSIEILIISDFLIKLKELVQIIKKVTKVVYSSSISDHWKEKIIPNYAFLLMRSSFFILAILLLIIAVLLLLNFFGGNFFKYLFSFLGVIESIVVAYVYLKFRKLIIK